MPMRGSTERGGAGLKRGCSWRGGEFEKRVGFGFGFGCCLSCYPSILHFLKSGGGGDFIERANGEITVGTIAPFIHLLQRSAREWRLIQFIFPFEIIQLFVENKNLRN
jgi:hypothetical protein